MKTWNPVKAHETLIQAAPRAVGGLLANDNYIPEITDILQSECPFWSILSKKPAPDNIVRDTKKASRPSAGPLSKLDLSNSPPTTFATSTKDTTDTGEEVKAYGGVLEFPHFAHSLAEQQGSPYGDEVASDTADLIIEHCTNLEKDLFGGDASTNALQFNGLGSLVPNDNVYTLDITGATPPSIAQKLNEIMLRASSGSTYRRRVTHFMCSGTGQLLLQNEIDEKHLYQNQVQITPVIEVPAIRGAGNIVPMVTSPYVFDVKANGTSVTTDTIVYYLIDINLVEWRGVYPKGGERTFDPQIFDLTNYSTNFLGMPRMSLNYGCLKGLNNGEGIFKLEVTAPAGTTWSPVTAPA